MRLSDRRAGQNGRGRGADGASEQAPQDPDERAGRSGKPAGGVQAADGRPRKQPGEVHREPADAARPPGEPSERAHDPWTDEGGSVHEAGGLGVRESGEVKSRYVEQCAKLVNAGQNAVQVIGNGDVFDADVCDGPNGEG